MVTHRIKEVVESLKLIHSEEIAVAFDPISLRFFGLEPDFYKLLKGLQEGNVSYDSQEVITASDLLETLSKQLLNIRESTPKLAQWGEREIGRVTILVTNDCNLRCSYCYAQGGSYGMPRGVMSPQTAHELVEFLIARFDLIERVVFFGGEPLLNPKAIELICEELTEYHRQGRLKQLPLFAVITNGTILNEGVMALLKKHIYHVTVSIDGDASMHDANRRDAQGNPSWEKVDRFVRTFQRDTNISIHYEATYNATHRAKGLSMQDVEGYMRDTYGLDGDVMPDTFDDQAPAYLPEIDNTSVEAFANSAISSEPLRKLLHALISTRGRNICPVGSGIVAIDTNGNILPCHLVAGEQHLRLGSIHGENVFDNPSAYYAQHPELKLVRKQHPTCQACWVRNLCEGCAIILFYNREKKAFNQAPPITKCEHFARFTEEVIVALVKFRKNPDAWKNLLAIDRTHRQESAPHRC